MRQQIFIDDEYNFDYELVDHNKHTLYFSNSEYWTEHTKGTIAFQLEDDGNGLNVLTKFSEKGRIDYSEVEYLFILLKIIQRPAKYEIAQKRLL
jgi:hypothetical protein